MTGDEILEPRCCGSPQRAGQRSSRTALSSPVSHLQSASASPMAIPANYLSGAVECSVFLSSNFRLYLEIQSQEFSSEQAKVAIRISSLPPLQQPQASSSWERSTEACSHASTLRTPQWLHCQAHLSSSPGPGHPWGTLWGPVSSQSWTCGAPITTFISGKATSGRRRSLPLRVTMNIGLSHMTFQTPHSSSRGLWGIPGIPPLVCHRVHRRYPDLLPELGRTSHHVMQVPCQLRKHHLYLKLEKCEFHQPPHGPVPRYHPQCGWDPDGPGEGYTCILVVVDRFSKACELISLWGLDHSPRKQQRPSSIISSVPSASRKMLSSDRGPQIVSPCLEGFLQDLQCHHQPLLWVSLPRLTGQTEWKIQEIGRFLRA